MYRHIFASFIVTLLIATAWFETHMGKPDLPTYVKTRGRLVFAPGQKKGKATFDSHLQNLLDGNLESPIKITYPAELNEPTYILVDLGLTHWAPQKDGVPTIRKAGSIKITNGNCFHCNTETFRSTSRLKKIRIELLYRRANNIDQEYEFPPIKTVFSTHALFKDQPQQIDIDLNTIPAPLYSRKWPENMFYLIAKIVILDVYPGTKDNKLAISELTYKDNAHTGTPNE